MPYQPNTIYHIYNQGNNRSTIFFCNENYLFFLKKMRKQLLPYVDILAYCLMPNHFHFLVYTRPEACHRGNATIPGKPSQKQQNLSKAIGYLLSNYAKAINKQEDRIGALFRNKTRHKEFFIEGFMTIEDKLSLLRSDYAATCFDYIHNNPVKAKFVNKAVDWTYSSAKDYSKLRNGTMCNQELAFQLEVFRN